MTKVKKEIFDHLKQTTIFITSEIISGYKLKVV